MSTYTKLSAPIFFSILNIARQQNKVSMYFYSCCTSANLSDPVILLFHPDNRLSSIAEISVFELKKVHRMNSKWSAKEFRGWYNQGESMPFALYYSVQSNAASGIRVTCHVLHQVRTTLLCLCLRTDQSGDAGNLAKIDLQIAIASLIAITRITHATNNNVPSRISIKSMYFGVMCLLTCPQYHT